MSYNYIKDEGAARLGDSVSKLMNLNTLQMFLKLKFTFLELFLFIFLFNYYFNSFIYQQQ
jgi:hypothetical protein